MRRRFRRVKLPSANLAECGSFLAEYANFMRA